MCLEVCWFYGMLKLTNFVIVWEVHSRLFEKSSGLSFQDMTFDRRGLALNRLQSLFI